MKEMLISTLMLSKKKLLMANHIIHKATNFVVYQK